MEHFPALNADCFDRQIAERPQLQEPPRMLILYGSLRERSYSRFAAVEAGRLLTAMGELYFRAGELCVMRVQLHVCHTLFSASPPGYIPPQHAAATGHPSLHGRQTAQPRALA